ncbi:MAG: DUF5618 family protein [Ignavibacteriales bacterium]|nr:DUF5618 family protein [Ignavibacteriales bacterium]
MREALRYIENARETLKKSPIEEGRYKDNKYVKSACVVAYLGVPKAIDEFLLRNGIARKQLPKKVEEHQKALTNFGSSRNGKMLDALSDIYDELHIAGYSGYYRGFLHRVEVVKEALGGAEEFIRKLN